MAGQGRDQMATVVLSDTLVFDVSKYGEIGIELSGLTAAQIEGALVKGLHEFLKDAHAGKDGEDARAAVEAKLQRLYEGAVPGLGHGGGGKRLDAFERACREEAEAIFRQKEKAEVARKMAQDWRSALRAAAEARLGADHPELAARLAAAISTVESRARAKIEATKGLPTVDFI